MNLKKSLENISHWQPTLHLSLVLILIAVCLTGCSQGLEGLSLAQWKGKESLPQTSPIAAISATPAANIPDAPADIVKCVQKPSCTAAAKANPSKTADQAALDCAQSDEERRVCSRKLLQYYDGVKKANGGTVKPKEAEKKPKAKKTAEAELKKLEP